MPPLPYAELPLPPVFLDGDAAPGVARRHLSTGTWIRVRRGAYVPAATLTAEPHLRARQLVLARASATVRQSTADLTLSHDTAAVVWGLPVLEPPARTHLVQDLRRSGGAAADVVRHYRPGAALDRLQVHGLPVTTRARTVVDCALTLGVRAGLVVADAALASGLSRQDCADLVAASPGARGVRAARTVLEFADDGAESPAESLARWAVLRAGFPPPLTQVAVRTHLGTFWLDLGWPEWSVGVEVDGAIKYTEQTREALLAEKRRQDAIEDAGWRLIRLAFADLHSPQALAARLLRALAGRPVPLTPRRALGC